MKYFKGKNIWLDTENICYLHLAAAMDCATWTPSQLRRGSWPQGVAGLRLAQVEAGSQGVFTVLDRMLHQRMG